MLVDHGNEYRLSLILIYLDQYCSIVDQKRQKAAQIEEEMADFFRKLSRGRLCKQGSSLKELEDLANCPEGIQLTARQQQLIRVRRLRYCL